MEATAPRVVQAQHGWGVTYTSTEICALKGSTVDIRCTYTYPANIGRVTVKAEKTFWFTKQEGDEYVDLRTESEYEGRVEYHGDQKNCNLRIKDLRETDSAVYQFRFITNHSTGKYTGSPGVTLTVTTDLQVQVTRSTVYQSYTWAELQCHSSCRLASYIWYKNGQNIRGETSSSYTGNFYPGDKHSCAVKGLEDFRSPPVCVRDQTCNRVTYTDRSICALKGSSVDISCTYSSYDNYVESKFWFSPKYSDQWRVSSQPEALSGDSGRVQQLEAERGRSTLRITDLRESDSAEYRFKFKTQSFEWESTLPGTTLTVTDLKVQVTRLSVHQSYTWAELKCHSSCRLAASPSYVWYKNGQNIRGVTSSYTGYFYPEDSYSCAVKGQEDFRSPSVYAPKVPSVLVSPSGEIVEGSSVTLTCSSDANPAATYTWYKENGNPDHKPLKTGPQLDFVSIQSSDSGEYYCSAENDLEAKRSVSISINVKYAPKVPSVLVSPSGETVEGSSVNLTCSSDANPAATYTWYKENGNPDRKPLKTEPQLDFVSIQSSDSGEYYCSAENELGAKSSDSISINVKYAPKVPSVLVSPSGETVGGSSVNLTCSSDANPAATYTWYKENGNPDRKPLKTEPQLDFVSIQSSDSGEYYCSAENELGAKSSDSISINVKYGPKVPSVLVSPSGETVEGSSVTLTCSSDANPAATYTWYKENEASPKASGQTFTITDIRPEHSGNYYCEAQNRRGHNNSTLQLTVVAAPRKSTAAAITTTLLLVIILLIGLFVFLRIRRKRASKQPSGPGQRPDNGLQLNQDHVCDTSAAAETQPTEQQDDLDYATVHFSKTQPDPLYSNFRPQRREEEEETVQYAAVNFKRPQTDPGSQEADEDPSELYSTVQKPKPTKPRF
ncbi:Fc receptor-like protein 2 [Centroberyx affinis]|uniref:Fc receptor-like protein 2 n=1 Tax=Centroberyx affinis TaxID=166261 RepID=UPI003A5C693D